jgi:hypothetical protein
MVAGDELERQGVQAPSASDAKHGRTERKRRGFASRLT